MAYVKTNWKDRVVERPNTYTMTDNGNGTVTLTPVPGQIIERGTPLNAENLNKIEDAIVETNTQLSKKIFRFDSVDEMKSYNLKIGDACETLGYYAINDGGTGLYRIRDKIEGERSNGFVHILDNGLVAELVIKNNVLNFRQLGAKSEEDSNYAHIDCKKYLNIYLQYMSENKHKYLKLLIPSGIWVFSETLINTPNVNIEGEVQFFNDITQNATIITALGNQKYVWKLGGNQDFDYTTQQSTKRQINIGGLTFSSGLYTSNTSPVALFEIEKSALYIDNVSFCYFKTLNFNFIYGTALALSTCWELYFDILNFRFIYNHNNPCVLFDEVHQSTGVAHPNISAVEINTLMFEVCNGDYIKFHHTSALDNVTIHHINIEGSFANGYQEHGVIGAPTESENYHKECIFSLGQASNLIIESINTQLIGGYYHECNGVKYCRNLVFNYNHNIGSQGAKFKGIVNNITLELTKIAVVLVNQVDGILVNFDNNLIINNVFSHSISNKGTPKFYLPAFSGLYLDNIYVADEGVANVNNNLMKLPYNYCFLNSATSWTNKTVVSDSSSKLPINLCVKKTPDNDNSTIMKLLSFKPSVVSLLIKIPKDTSIQVSFTYLSSGVVKTEYPAYITGTGEYKWYDFDLSTLAIDGSSYLNINCSSLEAYFALYKI